MQSKHNRNGKYMGGVKVGPKGQIVIPKEVREMFDIKPGDTLMMLGDGEKGIALERYEYFTNIADSIFAGKAKELYPEKSEEDSRNFAEFIKKVTEGEIK